jgi:uncharacterized protein with von Willebrand factor type A (vWA) domain
MPDDQLVDHALARFTRALRDSAGIERSPAQLLAFRGALAAVPSPDADSLYWCGRATLDIRPHEVGRYDRVFAEYFLGVVAQPPPSAEPAEEPTTNQPGTSGTDAGEAVPLPVSGDMPRDRDSDDDSDMAGAQASTIEVLRVTSFDACSAEEQELLRALIRRLRVRPPLRRTRRLSRSARGRIDLRRTARTAWRRDGEVSIRWRDRRLAPRRIVMLLDVSRSMAPYSRLLLHFAHAISASGLRVEVVCFGTRVTRVTRLLTKTKSATCLEAAAATVLDWDGGTRIGQALRTAQQLGVVHAALRDSVVVVLSDGLEQDDPEHLAHALARLRRTCHSLLWANPLAGDPRYEPLTAGMVAAMPYVDVLCAADTLRSLERLAASLGSLSHPVAGRRPRVGPPGDQR